MMSFRIILALTLALAASHSPVGTEVMAQRTRPVSLQLEAKIPLGEVRGRIDHMAIDLKRERLFVAELGNNSIGVVDLSSRKVAHMIGGLKEPQGIGYVPGTDTLYIASAGDGSVRLFHGVDYSPIGRIDLGDDADNIRVDAATNRVYIGYGGGALAVIDSSHKLKIGTVPLKAHPESFQLDTKTNRIFINLPDARSIAVVDRSSLRQVARWPTPGLAANFPMALDEDRHNVLVAFRRPAKLGVFSTSNGSLVATTRICGDADDVFFDAKRQHAYISCGAGFIDVIDTQDTSYRRLAHIPTAPGARTSLFVPTLDLLLLAVRASPGQQPAIWAFHPTP